MVELIISQIWPYLLGAAGLIVAYFGVRQSGKAAGRQETRQEINEAEAAARKEARDVELETDAMADADIDDDLAKWVRQRKP